LYKFSVYLVCLCDCVVFYSFLSFFVHRVIHASILFPYTTLFRSHLKNIWTAPLPPETELSRQMTTSTTSIDIWRESSVSGGSGEIGRAVQQECRDRSRMPSSA